MQSDPRGRAIILSIRKFDNLEVRRGAEADKRQLSRVFKQLNFHVETWEEYITAEVIIPLSAVLQVYRVHHKRHPSNLCTEPRLISSPLLMTR